jgi:hypothetical protein
MNNEIYSKNLEALKKHPALYNLTLQVDKNWSNQTYAVENSKSGLPFLTIKQQTGRPVSYHSRYDPVKEALRQVETSYDGQSHALVLGFALGYNVQELLPKLPTGIIGPQIFVVEPDPAVFVAALKARDLSAMLSDPRVAWCVAMTPDQIGEYWTNALDWTVMEKLAIVDHPPSAARFKGLFERIVEKVRYLCNRSKGNLVTLMHAGTDFHTNNFANLGDSFILPGIARLFDKFKQVPAIIVAAGPSLDKNMYLLHQIKGKFPIIAVDTAFRQLEANGISPDIVCAADPSYENSLDFVGVENVEDVVLAVEPMTHPDIFSQFRGPKMLMTFGGGLYPIYKDYREPVGQLICWGSIATTVFDLAKNLGADPLVFIGLDLSFQDGRLHAKGSYSDDLLYEKVHPFTSIEHETVDYIATRGAYKILMPDKTVLYTDQNMKLYKDWFEDQFRQTDRTIINATEGGAVDRFVKIARLADVIKHYENKAVAVKEIIRNALQKPVEADIKALLGKFREIRKRLHKNESLIKKSVPTIRKLIKNMGEQLPAKLGGRANAEFFDILQLHDELCSDKELFPWISVHQAKFMTRHIMGINSLKADGNATVSQWLNAVTEMFAAQEKFFQYQIPLLEIALKKIEKAGKSITPIGASTYE